MFGCLLVGWLLFLGGARAPGAALLGSAAGALLVLFTPFHSDHLESLVHNAVIGASVGLVVFGLAGLALGSADYPPLGSSRRWRWSPSSGGRWRSSASTRRRLRPARSSPDSGSRTGPRPSRRHASGGSRTLAPGAACVQRRFPRAAVPGAGVAGDAVIAEARTGERHHERRMGHVIGLFARNGTPFPFRVPPPGDDARSHVHHPGVRGCGPSSLPLRS